jgi:hypothetical protein
MLSRVILAVALIAASVFPVAGLAMAVRAAQRPVMVVEGGR